MITRRVVRLWVCLLLGVAFAATAVSAQDAPGPAPGALSAAARQSWVGRHPVLTGALIGAGGGFAWQASACHGPSCKLCVATAVGAGVGAYGGLVVSAIRKARSKQPVGKGTKIVIAAGAIGAVAGAFLACYGAGGCGGVS